MEPNQHPKYIAIHFTLKGQDFEQIKPILESIKKDNPAAILISGFMSREDLLEKGITDTTVPDTLKRLFPEQRSFFKDGEVRRRDMFAFAYDNMAKVYVIGRIKDGVKEETVLYLNAGVDVIFIRLDSVHEESSGPVILTDKEADHFLGINNYLTSFGNYLFSEDRYNKISEAHPEWKKADINRHASEVSHADIENWLNHPNRLSFLNNKNTQNVEDQNKDLAQGAGSGTAEQSTTGSNENQNQQQAAGLSAEGSGESEAASGEQNAGSEQASAEGGQDADAGTNAGSGQE